MFEQYFNVFLFWAIGLFFTSVSLIFAYIISPKKPSKEKQETYECGIVPTGQAWGSFSIGYYLFILVFVIFSIETIFLFPIAVIFKQFGFLAFWEVFFFVAILILGLVYALAKKALNWW